MTIAPKTQERKSSRYHRVDEDFLNLLEEDFGIDLYSLNKAFMGIPLAPKKQAIALCSWAVGAAEGDAEKTGDLLRAWARRRKVGLYDQRLVNAPEITYEYNDYLRSIGRL